RQVKTAPRPLGSGRPRLAIALGGGLVLAAASTALAGPLTGDAGRAMRAQAAIIQLDGATARDILGDADPSDGLLALERGRLALYDGDCDGAVAILSRPELVGTQEGAELLQIARGGARATAATIVMRDDDRGVVVTLQDEDD